MGVRGPGNAGGAGGRRPHRAVVAGLDDGPPATDAAVTHAAVRAGSHFARRVGARRAVVAQGAGGGQAQVKVGAEEAASSAAEATSEAGAS